MIKKLDELESKSLASRTDDNILDESDADDTVPPLRYDITSYGIDFDVAGIVRRLDDEGIFVPGWQRRYVWNAKQASSFIESLLFGLPVPGIFLGRETESSRLYVIDGQQRLKTLQFFYSGEILRPNTRQGGSPFKLIGVDSRFKGLTIEDLNEKDRRDLDNSLIHATVVRQDSPPDNDTSMYQIFKRLNTGVSQVNPHEIRCAVYQGELIDTIQEVNNYPKWRGIIGRPSPRLKDQELILRFMAMWYKGDEYSKPMAEFLNVFTQQNRNPGKQWLNETTQLFMQTVSAFADAKDRPFRLSEGRAVNAAVFDSMAIGLARRIAKDNMPKSSEIAAVHDSLIEDDEYLRSVTQGTSDESSVQERIRVATAAFDDA